ncbi:unnamed protein product [Thlaspi arvense]|uniref:Choline transporter-like protein n=1 Tax=Thlaspi arvense TaxID=13288 RepID=A0AAU9S2P5_THLAR|nr:unnamed protein product [Thlaspi arvense]
MGLTYGLDYEGNVCGSKHRHRDLNQLELRYWLNPNQVYESGLKDGELKLANARTICLLDCPAPSDDTLNWVCDYPDGEIRLKMNDWIDRNYDYFEFLTPEMRNSSLQLQGPCYPVIFPSVNVYWSCQYIARASNSSLRHWQQMGGVEIQEDMIIDKSIRRSLNSRASVLKRYVADIGKSWPVLIVCGGLVPLHMDSKMLISSVAGWIGNDAVTPIIGEHDPYFHVYGRELTHVRGVAILMTFISVVAILTSIAIIRRILMATSVLKVAAKVIGEVHALIIFPAIPYAMLAVFYMFWLSAALHLFSSGQVVPNNCNNTNCCAYDLVLKKVNCDHCCGYSIRYTPHITIAIFFHLFGCYWATQFFVASSATVIAGSVASYYWAQGEASPEIPFLPVFASMKRLARYNLGSVALGSLIVSFVESVRFILEAIRRRTKVSGTTPDHWFWRMGHYTSRGCLKSVEWTIKSVNRNAYIMIAITGKSFCKSSAIATELIINNIMRIGKACWALGYIVATLFFAVVEMSIDTIILSFCQDSEENQGNAQHAPPLLLETLDSNQEEEVQRLTH